MTQKADLKPIMRLKQRDTLSGGSYFVAYHAGRSFVMLKGKGAEWLLLERVPLPEPDAGACLPPQEGDASPGSGNG